MKKNGKTDKKSQREPTVISAEDALKRMKEFSKRKEKIIASIVKSQN